MVDRLQFRDSSRRVFSGHTYRDVVRSLRDSSWMAQPKGQYMRGVAQRLKALGTSDIKSHNAKEFIHGLVQAGWLKRVAPKRKSLI